jgi:hypothetical protein
VSKYNLEAPAHLAPVAEYYTAEEMAKFKRPEQRKRKKKSTRKKESLADVISATTVPSEETVTSSDHGSRATRTGGTKRKKIVLDGDNYSAGVVEQKMKEEKAMKAQNYEKALARAAEESKILYSADILRPQIKPVTV